MTNELHELQQRLDFLYDQLDKAMMLDDTERVYRIEAKIEEARKQLEHTYIPLI